MLHALLLLVRTRAIRSSARIAGNTHGRMVITHAARGGKSGKSRALLSLKGVRALEIATRTATGVLFRQTSGYEPQCAACLRSIELPWRDALLSSSLGNSNCNRSRAPSIFYSKDGFMIRKLRLVAAVLGSILAVSLAGAQTHGGGVSARMSSAAVRPAARISGSSSTGFAARSAAVRPATAFRISPGGHVISSFVPLTNSIGYGSGIGVPGLGFDYPHLAAISGALRERCASRFPARKISRARLYRAYFFRGIPLLL